MVYPGSNLQQDTRAYPSGASSTLPPVGKERSQAKRRVRTVNDGYTSARLQAARSTYARKQPIPPQSLADRGKLTLVLDLDECLIHSRLSSDQESFRQEEERKCEPNACDEFVFQLEDGEVVRVNKRPGLDKFLQAVSKDYEVMVYTAGIESYAGPLLDILDPHKTIFRARLFRDSCIYANGIYTKDLARFNRQMNRIVLVDNNAMCFLPQLSNGIPISAFYDDHTDTALTVLLSFLERIKDEADVRPFLQRSFNLESLLKEHRQQILG